MDGHHPPSVTVTLAEDDQETVVFGNYAGLDDLIVPPEPDVAAPPPEAVEVPEEKVGAPRTGEFPPLILYGVGMLLILAGVILAGKRWLTKR